MKSSGSWKRPLLAALVAVGLATPSVALAQITVGSPDTEIEIGGSAGVTVSISGTNNQSATYSDEVQFDADNFDIDCPSGVCVGTSCTLDARLSGTHILQATRPSNNSLIFGVIDTAPPVATFGDGPLFTCTFSAKSTASPVSSALTSVFLEVANVDGDPLTATAEYGDLIAIEPPPATATHTATQTAPPTNTPPPTNTQVPATNTPTRTVTNTPGAGADDGCNMNPNASSFPIWLLLPIAVLPLLRSRSRS